MYPVLNNCPVCGETLTITRLHCRNCDTSIEGRFYAGRLSQLTHDQLAFVEIFVRNEGKIKDVEKELGISYPTVRKQLREVVTAMGYEAAEDDADIGVLTEDERKQVLDDLAAGRITSQEAISMLRGQE